MSSTVKTENSIERHLCDTVRACGGRAYKFKSPGHKSVPDRHCRLPYGVEFFVECKASGEEPTPAQKVEHNRLRSLGAKVYISDSKERNLEIVKKEFITQAVAIGRFKALNK